MDLRCGFSGYQAAQRHSCETYSRVDRRSAQLNRSGSHMARAITVAVFNPLPVALAHYELALKQVLRQAGCDVRRLPVAGIERGDRSRTARLGGQLKAYSSAADRLNAISADEVLVLWPAAGYWEAALWALLPTATTRAHVVIHDVRPLRRQFASGEFSGRAAAAVMRRWSPQVVTHTLRGADTLRRQGWRRVSALPLPIMARNHRPSPEAPRTAAPRLLVLGQYKSARDLHLLKALGARNLPGVTLRLVGRGWPQVPGWDVVSHFLSEQEFEAELDAASVLLVPYREYWQSEVLARAFARGLPAIGGRHEQMEGLYGDHYAGMVPDLQAEAVVSAFEAVAGTSIPHERIAAYVEQVSESWRAYFTAECRL